MFQAVGLKRFAVWLGASLVSMAATAEGVAVWDLTSLIQEAAQRHPSVLNARKLADAADADIEYAQRQRYPELSVNSLSGADNTTAALVIKQPVWAGGAIDAAEAVSRASAQVQQVSAEEQSLTIALRVVEAWQNYVLSAEKIDIVDQGITQLEELVAMMQRRVDAKISPRVELELAQARVIQARIGRATLVAERDLAVKRMQELVGRQINLPDREQKSNVMQPWLDAIKKHPSLPSPSELEEIARYQPTVRRVQAEALVADAEVKQTEAGRWPSVFLQYQQGINQVITNDKRVGLALEYAPGRGFSSRERVRGAVARAQARDINIQTAIRDARDSLSAKMQEMSRTRALEASWVPAVSASEQLLASYQRQFIAGRKSWQDVLNQQNDLTQGRQSLVDARIRWVVAYAQLHLQMAAKPAANLTSQFSLDHELGVTSMVVPTSAAQSLGLEAQTGQQATVLMTHAVKNTNEQKQPNSRLDGPRLKVEGASHSRASDLSLWRREWQTDDLFDVTASGMHLRTGARAEVRRWVAALQAKGVRLKEVRTVGYSDPLGTPEAVVKRSKEVAQRVAQALKAEGLQAQRWQTQWVGATQPLDVHCGFEPTQSNRSCHRVNRRVLVEVTPMSAEAVRGKH